MTLGAANVPKEPIKLNNNSISLISISILINSPERNSNQTLILYQYPLPIQRDELRILADQVMGQVSWEADKMLDVYIYDYLVKRDLQATAKSFMAEGKVATDPVAIDAPGGFLFEWWSVFWDIFIARTNEKHSDVAATYFETQQMKAKEQQSKMQQYQQMQMEAASLQRRDANRPPLGGTISDPNSDGILGSSAASPMAGKVYSEHVKNPNTMESEALKSTTSHTGLLVQGQSGTIPSALQQIQGQNQQTTQDMKPSSIVPQRSLPMDPSALYGQRPVQGKSGLGGGAGLNQGGGSHAFLNGWPLQKIQGEQVRSSFGSQGQRPFLLPSNQYQASSQQQLLGQAQAYMQGNIGSSHAYAAMQRSGFNVKDGQLTGNGGQVGSPMQPSTTMVKSDLEYLLKVQHSPAQRPQELLQQQHQLQQNNRKRKPASSGAANSSGTGNTLGPSNSQPSTPSTSTPGDGVAMGSNLPHVSSMPKCSMMYNTDGAGGLGSSANQMDDLEHFGDIGTLDDHVESFLSNDEDARDMFAPSKNSPAEHNAETSKGINEAACNQTSNNKVLCCHFSSDGTLLASAGHDKKVLIWNTATFNTVISPEEHMLMITDIRFRPDSTQLATSSFDRTIRLWNAAESICHLHTFTGHSSQVMSLDFHPKKTDLLCSCDDNGEIWLWNVNQHSGAPFFKGGSQQVRFQPRVGQLLAAASENIISIFEFESKRKIRSLQGHNKEVQSVCWDPNGEYLATVSHDTVKVWSVASGVCTHELRSTSGNNFHSCVFHPTHSGLLVIGGYQYLQLWDMAENKSMPVRAHDGLISALAQSVRSGYIASASHDKVVKLWK